MNFDDLEHRPQFRWLVLKRNFFLAAALLADLAFLGFVASLRIEPIPHSVERVTPPSAVELLGFWVSLEPFSWATLGWIAGLVVLQIFLAQKAFATALSEDEHTFQLHPVDKSGGRRFGRLTAAQIVGMVQELAQQLGVGKVARVYVTDQPDPNAYTTRLPGWGNVVVLHSNLLEVLPVDGVRCIIAHEVAHIRRGDSLIYLLTSMPMTFLWIVAGLTFVKVVTGVLNFDTFPILIQRVAFLLALWWGFTEVVRQLGRLGNLASQQSEFIADAYAAAACGWSHHLNALLLVGERAEALGALAREIAELPQEEQLLTETALLRILRRFPPRELSKDVARKAAVRLFIEDQLATLQKDWCVPLTEGEIRDLAQRASASFKAKQKEEETRKKQEGKGEAKSGPTPEEIEAEEEKSLLDWREFDLDHSGHLDAVETQALVKKLTDQPDRMLFRQFLAEEAEWQTHPTMRDRVLGLNELFGKVDR